MMKSSLGTKHKPINPKNSNTSEPATRLSDVINDIQKHMKTKLRQPNAKNTRHATKKSFAREIVNFLNTKYNLSAAVVIGDFVADACEAHKTELSKVQSQLALSTQRAAALFALETNLLKQTLDELRKQIEATKETQVSSEYKFFPEYYHKEFVEPLERQAGNLQNKVESADKKQKEAQQRFEVLRQEATEPIMVQLQQSSKSYAALFKNMKTTSFCNAVKKLDVPIVASEVRQTLSEEWSSKANTCEYLHQLYREAQQAKPKLHNALKHVQGLCQATGKEVAIEMGELKALERAIEKTVEEYAGDFSRLVDVTRGSLVCASISDAKVVIEIIGALVRGNSRSQPEPRHRLPFQKKQVAPAPPPQMKILRVKNRLDPAFPASAESGGYRDLLMNVRLDGGHVCELQVHIKSFMEVKTGGGHKVYTIARSLHLLDPELGQVRVSAGSNNVQVAENEIRVELIHALKRVKTGTCQGLYLNHLKLTRAECEALKNALLSPASNVREIALPSCGLNKVKCDELCLGVEGSLGEFLKVNLFNNKGITGACVGLFVSAELRELSVRRCGLELLDAKDLAQAFSLRRPDGLTEFSTVGNDMGIEGIQMLAASLAGVPVAESSLNPNKRLQTDEELQDMLIFALKQRSLDGVMAACQQGGRWFEPSSQSKQAPVEFCEQNNFVEGFDEMVKGTTTSTLSLEYLNSIKFSPDWTARVYQGLAKHLATCGTRLIARGPCRTIDIVSVVKLLESESRCMTHLTELDLAANKFGAQGTEIIFNWLAGLSSLNSLNLEGSGIGPEGAKHLTPALTVMTSMTNLNLERNSIKPEGAKQLASGLAMMTNITNLNLRGNGLGPEGAKHLAPALTVMASMTNLNLERNALGPEGSKHLALALTGMTNMANLNLADNVFESVGAKNLAPALTLMANVTNLNLAGNGLGPEGAKHIAPAMTVMTNMTNLNLEKNVFGPEGAKHFAPALTMMTHKTNLNLRGNSLGPEGAKHLAPALTLMTNMTNLNFEDNGLGPEGAKYLASALTMMTHMTNLNFEINVLRTEGAKHLAPALTVMTSLTNLNLEKSSIGPDGAKHFAPALSMMTNMTDLNLFGNGLGPEGAKHLAPALIMMTNMTDLNLAWNSIGPEGAHHIASALTAMTNLTSLNLADNRFDAVTKMNFQKQVHIKTFYL